MNLIEGCSTQFALGLSTSYRFRSDVLCECRALVGGAVFGAGVTRTAHSVITHCPTSRTGTHTASANIAAEMRTHATHMTAAWRHLVTTAFRIGTRRFCPLTGCILLISLYFYAAYWLPLENIQLVTHWRCYEVVIKVHSWRHASHWRQRKTFSRTICRTVPSTSLTTLFCTVFADYGLLAL